MKRSWKRGIYVYRFITAHMVLVCVLITLGIGMPALGKDDKLQPKEYGVYVQSNKTLKRLMPNVVFDQEGVIFVESNNPPVFLLKDVEQFVLYGNYDVQVLTINPLLFFRPSPLGKMRHVFGKNIEYELKKRADELYTVKPKGLLGRGYFSLWINETAWDFVIE